MARAIEFDRNREVVDALVDDWRDRCLIADDSLIYPGKEIWTKANFQALTTLFVEDQLKGQKTFEEKLEAQLGGADRSAIILMAEVIAMYFAFATRTAAGPDKKREVINFVLALVGEELDGESAVAEAMNGSIGGPGQAFNNYRPNLLIYMIQFGVNLKEKDAEGRRQLLKAEGEAGAWRFQSWLDEHLTASAGGQTMRNVLLHLLFPDYFERIASDDDKSRIVNSLSPLVEGLDPTSGSSQVDQCIWKIRNVLNELLPEGQPEVRGGIDFYYTPLRESWDPDPSGRSGQKKDSGLSHLDALETKRQVVLHGPPGTGKTFEAKQLAGHLIRHQAMVRWGPVSYLESSDRLEEIVNSQTKRLQLHPAYSYEDFVGGLRLVDGETKPEKGYLLRMIDEINKSSSSNSDPAPLPWVLILDEINRTDLSRLLGEVFSALDDRGSPIELSVAGTDDWGELRLPNDLYFIGTMNLIDQSVEQLDFALRRRFFWLESGFDKSAVVPVVQARWNQLLEESPNPQLKNHKWAYLEPEIEVLADRAEALNAAITGSNILGRQYELGHTYFFEVGFFISRNPRLQAKGAHRKSYLWNAKSGEPTSALVDLWSHSLEPLLREYLAGLPAGQAENQLEQLRKVFLSPWVDE